jgi:hypothetical protein
MKFIKANSYEIVRFIVIQLGLSIFGLVLTMACHTLNKGLLLPVSLFSIGFYLFLVYSVAWENGSKDKIRVDAGRLADRKGRGFAVMLMAQGPYLLLTLLMLIGGIVSTLGAQEVGSGLFTFPYLIVNFFSSIYLGTMKVLFGSFGDQYLISALVHIALTIPAIVTAGIGYFLGASGARILAARTSKPPRANRK